jgi:hypothetical protein
MVSSAVDRVQEVNPGQNENEVSMDKFREAVEMYCEYGAEHDCNMCAMRASCYIAGRGKRPNNMSDREIEIMFVMATEMWSELKKLLDSIDDKPEK